MGIENNLLILQGWLDGTDAAPRPANAWWMVQATFQGYLGLPRLTLLLGHHQIRRPSGVANPAIENPCISLEGATDGSAFAFLQNPKSSSVSPCHFVGSTSHSQALPHFRPPLLRPSKRAHPPSPANPVCLIISNHLFVENLVIGGLLQPFGIHPRSGLASLLDQPSPVQPHLLHLVTTTILRHNNAFQGFLYLRPPPRDLFTDSARAALFLLSELRIITTPCCRLLVWVTGSHSFRGATPYKSLQPTSRGGRFSNPLELLRSSTHTMC